MTMQLLSTEDQYLWQRLEPDLENTDFKDGIARLVTASSYALNQLCRTPSLLYELQTLTEFKLDDFPELINSQQTLDLVAFKQLLRQYRHRKLVEIIYLDTVKQAPLPQVLQHLSDLADLLIAKALEVCEKQMADKHRQPLSADGEPMHLNVVAMGKLGGRELNFSSDVDLICCYANDGDLDGFGHLSYQEFFTRVVKALSKCLAENTEDGFVYRVDLRLRPWGDSGPVVLSHAALEHYYQLHGREWEQYAMVKARVLTGSESDRDYLASILKPFVYRKYHDYRVFEGLATLKDKINNQAQASGMRDNIKLGPGGIREIEFFVQAFQILKGGRNNQLQSPEILHCLDILQAQQIIDIETVKDLRSAYVYLRLLENRIQMFDDEQTHSFPPNEVSRQRIASAMGEENWNNIEHTQQQHRQTVSRHFSDLFKRNKQPEQQQRLVSDDSSQQEQLEFLHALDIESAEPIQQSLQGFFQSKSWQFMSAKAKQRFGTLLPKLLTEVAKSNQKTILFERLLKLFSSIAGRSVYFELLHQNDLLLVKLADLFDKSEWIADEVSRYPMLLEQLIQTGDLGNRFNHKTLVASLKLQLDNVVDDEELELDVLRLFKREQTIVIATAELAEEISTTEVSRYLSELAEILLNAVYLLSSKTLQEKYGLPQYSVEGTTKIAEMAIVGYGKLGGNEMHYQSDLDVIFLHNSYGEKQQTSGEKSIDNSFYFARLAQKIISMTSILTGSGKLYEIDSRLRPEGSSGLLVSSTQAYLNYQLEKAWSWEHQALVRARAVAGSNLLGTSFSDMRRNVLTQARDAETLRQDVLTMREKMYKFSQPPEGELRNLKHSRGCMIDIEFMVQYWVLRHANKNGSICSYSDNIHLLNELIRLNLISSSYSQLIDNYLIYHRWLHETVLQNNSAEIPFKAIEAEITQVIQSWNECFNL
ncbi:MAG: bifunctional [glutamate--ammonia ligase]-adenylyl-L-tyrosine phosphorylase/[glutamate--ammonia-ligase] adenylyltransferase [Gammaproteobacteria bacterium]|nr:bifunctional [glutamate--ammonia ligase]-adenylyl-L-tyrosine phosphorylase/[glutamate--ammonia-ligase] adenylyltransferase [Gammaproteobacteria bacterium]